MKELIEILLSECIKRDFKTLSSDGELHYTGMCGILTDLQDEGILENTHRLAIKIFLEQNRPDDVKYGHWYESNTDGNNKRIKFLEKLIDHENN